MTVLSASGVAGPSKGPSGPAWIASLLAGVAGAVDTTGFIALGGIFCAHVTGNFVLLGASLGTAEHELLGPKLAVLPLFIVGVCAGWWLARVGRFRGVVVLAACEALLLAAAAGCAALQGNDPASRMLWWAQLSAAVFAMGVQAVLSRISKLPMTNVMTGNVTQLTIDVLERGQRPEALRSAMNGLMLVGAFAAGAAGAGLGATRFGMKVLIVPAGLLALVVGASLLSGRRGAGAHGQT
ncbi:MAG: DUF1275 domain-containing protein [Tepidisphaera sp.]|nr:DUF1275 domain-containing protein [Tepidisphaera sp.]